MTDEELQTEWTELEAQMAEVNRAQCEQKWAHTNKLVKLSREAAERELAKEGNGRRALFYCERYHSYVTTQYGPTHELSKLAAAGVQAARKLVCFDELVADYTTANSKAQGLNKRVQILNGIAVKYATSEINRLVQEAERALVEKNYKAARAAYQWIKDVAEELPATSLTKHEWVKMANNLIEAIKHE